MYKSYGKKLDTPSRGTRKGMRNSVFIANKKMNKDGERRESPSVRSEIPGNGNSRIGSEFLGEVRTLYIRGLQ